MDGLQSHLAASGEADGEGEEEGGGSAPPRHPWGGRRSHVLLLARGKQTADWKRGWRGREVAGRLGEGHGGPGEGSIGWERGQRGGGLGKGSVG
uniref:Uncharacterized protein n=1 Tax=Oryza sativa subsp. japonica TaxID=39947 RepID=Q6ZCR1_ORYSJ|nr:hypothetical protein [Oryza sativa Japonica Group]